jgi:hypothetical protein
MVNGYRLKEESHDLFMICSSIHGNVMKTMKNVICITGNMTRIEISYLLNKSLEIPAW